MSASAAPAAAQAVPGPYVASASGDLLVIDGLNVLPAVLPGGGSLATAEVGHAESSTDTAAGVPTTAESANLAADLLFGGLPVPIGVLTATPTSGPQSGTLLPINLAPVATIGGLSGSVSASAGTPCTPSVAGQRVASRATTTIAQSTVVDSLLPGLGYLARIGASEITATTGLVDTSATSSVVEATTTATVGDIDLLGGAVVVEVASPVTLQARSDGTTGTASLVDPATITVTVAGTTTPIPLNGTPLNIPVVLPANPLLGINLQITGFNPTDLSSGATGEATIDDLLRISLSVDLVGLTVAQLGLSTAPLSVMARGPVGGINCSEGGDTDGNPDGDPGNPDTNPNGDPDGDGLPNTTEDQLGTDPLDPDTDNDGIKDGLEVNGLPGLKCKSDPLKQDTDRDKLADGKEYYGFKMKQKVKTSSKKAKRIGIVKTNPCLADTDGDKLKDGREVKGKKVRQLVVVRGGNYMLRKLISNPAVADTDKDGLNDRQEMTGSKNKKYKKHKTDPRNYDTDGGKIADGREIKLGSDPSNAFSAPKRNP
jgi:hypothetical protein